MWNSIISLLTLKAVCRECSNFFVKLPELSYHRRVRVCRPCIYQITRAKIQEKKKSDEQKRSNLGIFKSQVFSHKSDEAKESNSAKKCLN